MSATLRSTPSPHALASKKMVGIVQAVEDSYGPYVTPKAHQFIHYAALEAKKHNSAGVVKYCTKALNCMQPFIRRRVTVQEFAIIVTSCVKYPTALPHHTSCMRQGSWCVCCIMETFFAVVGMCPDRFGCRGTHPHRVHHDPDAEADIEARACFDDDDASMMYAAQRAAEEICRLQRARPHAESASSDSDSSASASSNGGRVRHARSAARAHAAPYARRPAAPTRTPTPTPDVAALADSLSAYAPFTPPTVDALAAQMAGYSIAQPAQEEKEQRARRALPSIAPLETVYASSVTVAGASDAESESSSSGGGRVRRSSRTSARSTASPYTRRSPRLAATPPPAAPAPSRAGSDSVSVSVRRSPRTSTSARAAASPYARPTASPPPTRRAPAPAPAPSPAPVAQELDALAAGLAAYTPFAPPTVDALVGQLAGTSLVESRPRARYTLPRVEVPLYASDQTVAGTGPKRASWPRTLAESVSVRC